MPLPRFRLRTLIAALAIAGFSLAAFRATTLLDVLVIAAPPIVVVYCVWALALPRALQHREYCLERARRHEAAEEEHRSWATQERHAGRAGGLARRAAYHEGMRGKWRSAANWPWQAVEPDSPPPPVESPWDW